MGTFEFVQHWTFNALAEFSKPISIFKLALMSTASVPTEPTAEVLKFDLPSILENAGEANLNGEFPWPISPQTFATLYKSSAEHCRAIHIKGQSAFGRGLIGKNAYKLDELTEEGFANLAMALDVDWETYGNAFMQIIRSRDKARILGLRRLPAITMTRFRKGYLQRTILPNGREKKTTFSADEIIQFRDPCPLGRRYSLPAWIGASGMLELAKAATDYNRAFFDNNAMPEYAVIYKGGAPTADQKSAIQEFFRTQFKGVDQAHRTLILSCGEDAEIEVKRLTSEVKDGDFLKLIDAARDRIPVAHAVPPRMLGIMSAGQLGGGGEVTGQLFTFEHLTCDPKRRKFLDQCRPVLDYLGLRSGDPDNALDDDQIAFKRLDLTPPKDDTEALPNLVSAGIMTAEEARVLLPALQNAEGGAQSLVQRSASTPPS